MNPIGHATRKVIKELGKAFYRTNAEAKQEQHLVGYSFSSVDLEKSGGPFVIVVYNWFSSMQECAQEWTLA